MDVELKVPIGQQEVGDLELKLWPFQLCHGNYPEEIPCVTQSGKSLWEPFELFVNKQVGAANHTVAKTEAGDGPCLGVAATSQPWELSGSQIRWDNR